MLLSAGFVIGAAVFVAVPASGVIEIGGRSVVLDVVKVEEMSSVPYDGPPLALKIVEQPVTPAQNVFTRLQANGVVPDSEALTLVYELNPEVNDVEEAALLRLPRLGDAVLQRLTAKRELVRLTVDPDLRKEITLALPEDTRKELQTRIAALDIPAETRKEALDLLRWYAQVESTFKRRTGPPLTRATLEQLLAEANTTQRLASHLAAGNTSQEDVDQLRALHGDLKLVMRRYGATLAGTTQERERMRTVRVKIDGATPAQLVGLRVYYTYNGLFREPPKDPPVPSYPFLEVGREVSKKLALKNYRVWAAEDGKPEAPLTPPTEVRLTDADPEPVPVTLTIKPAAQ